ncbi:MAGE-domain-containing protein [Conidiobolus coronatus NRRL 28638]|uniref:MAGE-domain-containing protein n=1 Tax=Conidiobolus coronatus (strain ATCC 28846 / CBS 209.66 / NRRL 28638) TaxID=796925 RepID=A0A137PAP0_CONC2|nr:MAGE-domain-containing protein [Conidiobolus coronatus NRRL 28638]|eukprot:KXN72024.1 MAGE-domain-containing protein [Conidiobolus coronatus NRRL 28638]
MASTQEYIEINDDSTNNNSPSINQIDELIERKAVQLVRYAIFNENKKAPIKKEDITKKILGDMSRSFQKVFDRAQQILKDVFGLKLVELPQKDTAASASLVTRRNAANKEKSYPRAYVLQSLIPLEILRHPSLISVNIQSTDHLALTMIILTLILVSDNYIQHPSLVQFLKTFEVDEEKQLKPCITQMIKQNYVVRLNSSHTGNATNTTGGDRDQTIYEYRWGPRAKVEITTDKLCGFLKQIYGDNYSDDIESEIKRTIEEMNPVTDITNTQANPSN